MKLKKGSKVLDNLLKSNEMIINVLGKYFWVMTVISILITLFNLYIRFIYTRGFDSITYKIITLLTSLLPGIFFWLGNFIVIVIIYLLVSIRTEVTNNK